MKNKKSIYFILLTIIISFIISLLFDVLIVNREVLGKKSDNNPKIVSKNNISLTEDNKYITTSNNSSITIKVKENYIKKINFDYKYKDNFEWEIECNDEVIKVSSTGMLNKAIKMVDRNASLITLKFHNKGITLNNFKINNDIYINWSRVILITISLSLFVILFKFREYAKNNLPKTFLLLSLVFGSMFIAITPKMPYNSFDDQIHYNHVVSLLNQSKHNYSYAEQILIEGINIRDNSMFSTREEKQVLYNYLNQTHKTSKDRVMLSGKNSNIYKKLAYLPFAIGYKLTNILNLNFTICICIAKFFNLLLYSLLFYLAIKYAKYLRRIIFVIGLFPTNIFYASQFSCDPSITAGLTLATTMFINMITDEKLNKKYLVIFMLSVIWACLPKAIYCPLLLLLLFIPNNKFDSKKQAYIFKFLIIFITMLLLATFVIPATTGGQDGDYRGGNTSVSGQLSYILHNPLNYAKLLLSYTFHNLLKMFIGTSNFVSFAYLIPSDITRPIGFICLLFFIYIVLTSVRPDFKFRYNILIVLEVASIWVLICTALYLSYTPVGEYGIGGVQTRYFIPIMLLSSVVFIFNKKKKENIYLFDLYFPILMLAGSLLLISLKVL